MLTGKHRQDSALSPSHEHYLRAIWELRSRQGYARLTDVARELGISHPTLSVGLRALERLGFVGHDAHRFLVLTAAGERLAREVHHRHRVLHTFLHELLGVSGAQAERDACLLEHDVSAETTDRILDLLKLMHADGGLRQTLRERLAGFHRDCRPREACATCDLACMSGVNPPA